MRPINYIDYDKLSDDVLYLGSNLFLRMNVSLSNKGDQDQRYHFHKEYRYDSKYTSNGKLLSIKRSFTYYLSLDKTDTKMNIMIRPQDMILFKMNLEQVSKWFSDNTFGTKGREVILRNRKESIVLPGLAQQRYIQFDPVVVVWENTGDQTPGVRVTLGDPSIYADISVDKLFALLYTISNFNMYESAQLLVNYLGRPNFGMNLYEIEDNLYLREQEGKIENAKNNRTIPSQKKSFFDSMDLMAKGD